MELAAFILRLLAFSGQYFLKTLKTFMFERAKRGQRKYFFFSTSESDGVFQIKFT